MSGDRKIAKYVEAKRELEALHAQLMVLHEAKDEPGQVAWMERWGPDLAKARTNTKLAYAALTGGELARAQRALTEATA